MRNESTTDLIERYLARLRSSCREAAPGEAEEFVREIHSHILDRISAEADPKPETVEAILRRVGDPRQLASRFEDQTAIDRAAKSLSPWTILRGMLRFGLRGVAGAVFFLITLVLYSLALVCLAVILLKPIVPHRTGLWLGPEQRITLGFWNGETRGAELYGISVKAPDDFVIGTLGPADGPVREMAGNDIYSIAGLLSGLFLALATLFARWVILRFASHGRKLSSSAARGMHLSRV
jgi:hypothetical protein